MPIKEESFRVGSGRYLQGRGYISKLREEILRLGTAPLIIGNKQTLGITREALTSVLGDMRYVMYEHENTCNDEDAEKLAETLKADKLDVVVGVGGGVIMDFAKDTAFFANLPIINVPTSSATCAAYTPISVRYTKEGRTVGSRHLENEIDCVIVDTDILIKQPVRLLLSGVYDAIAKYIETKQRIIESGDDYPLGLNWAYCLSKETYTDLIKLTPIAIRQMENGVPEKEFERLIFCAICVTGVISGIARGSNQCALAHQFYENARRYYPAETRPYLHGEIVGIGLLLQNLFNGEPENNVFLIEHSRKYGLPYTIEGVGLKTDAETKAVFLDCLGNGEAVDRSNPEAVSNFEKCLDIFFDMK